MYRSNPRKKDDDWEISPDKQRKIKTFVKNIPSLLVMFAVLGWFAWTIFSIYADIAGEYTSHEFGKPPVRLSLEHSEDAFMVDLSYGWSPTMVTRVPVPKENERVDWLFEVPQAVQNHGVKNRRVRFIGSVGSEKATGVIQDGSETFPVDLHRNLLVTLFRKAQAFWPVK